MNSTEGKQKGVVILEFWTNLYAFLLRVLNGLPFSLFFLSFCFFGLDKMHCPLSHDWLLEFLQTRLQVPQMVLQQIISLNSLDVELYKYAQSIFAKQHKHFMRKLDTTVSPHHSKT